MENDKEMSLTEVANWLQMSRQWVHRLYLRGEFPNTRKVGNMLIFQRLDIEALKATKPSKEAG